MNHKHKPDPWDDDPAPTFHGLTKAELAEATGYTINEITAFLRDGMPATPGKRKTDAYRFDLPAVVHWLASRNSDMDDAKKQNLLATADKRRMESARLAGKLVELEKYEAIAKDTVAKFRAEMKYVATHCPMETRATVQELHEAAINRLSAGLGVPNG